MVAPARKAGRRRAIAKKRKHKCKDKAMPLHKKQQSIRRKKIEISRAQADLERLEAEEKALQAGATARTSSRTKCVRGFAWSQYELGDYRRFILGSENDQYLANENIECDEDDWEGQENQF